MINTYNLIAHETIPLNQFLQKELSLALEKNESAISTSNSISISNSKIRRLIVAGGVSVNGKQCRIPSFLVKDGSSVKVLFDSGKFFYEKENDDITFELDSEHILFEDEYLIVVDKPAFFLTEKTFAKDRDSMHDAVVRYLQKQNPFLRNPPYVGIMHRLDRTTSGILLFTKKREVNKRVHEIFEHRLAQKKYRAICTSFKKNNSEFSCSIDFSSSFNVENYIDRITPKGSIGKWGVVQTGGKPSLTEFRFVGKSSFKGKEFFHFDAFPKTGRTHQIRVHLSHIGFPILGDDLYGGESSSRVFLHSHAFTFPHPITNESLTLTSPLPESFFKIDNEK